MPNPMSSRWVKGSLVIYPPEYPGTCFFVDSTNGDDTNNSGLDWENALATIDAAVDKCTASTGNTIYVAPWHVEDLAADSAVDVDAVGISIVGIRRGREMPTLTATAIAGDFKLAAASTSVRNIRFLSGVDATTGILEVSAADCAVIDCEFRDSVDQSTDGLITVSGADRLLIDGWKHFGAAAAGGNSAIALDGSDDCEIKNCYIYGNFAVGAIDLRTTASARVDIHDNKIWNANASCIAVVDTVTTSTGFIGPNLSIMLLTNGANITEAVTGATFQYIPPIYVCNLAGESAMPTNITALTDA